MSLGKLKSVMLVTNLLKEPFDEGAKVVAKHMASELGDILRERFSMITKSPLSLSTINKLVKVKPDYIIYLPEQSITFNSFLRAKFMSIFSGKKVIMISTQPREYNNFQKSIIRKLQPYKIFVQSKELKKSLETIGLTDVEVNTWGVDTKKFRQVSKREKSRLRKKYGIPAEGKVFLHFGHLKEKRNLDELEWIIRADKNNHVLIVCSTTTQQSRKVKENLESKGFNFITEFIDQNQELYQLADYYVFPTTDRTSAIEFPLSVFEALACGLPVFHKNFGPLKKIFQEKYSNVREYSNPEELTNPRFTDSNKFPIQDYSWNIPINNILQAIV